MPSSHKEIVAAVVDRGLAPPLILGLHLPTLHFGDVLRLFNEPTGWKYLAIIFPMGLFNVVGSLQCLESAEAAGDRYPTRP